MIGFESAFRRNGVSNSTFLGYKTGFNIGSGDSNVFIGYNAGSPASIYDQSHKFYLFKLSEHFH